jgi:hypothetical protein
MSSSSTRLPTPGSPGQLPDNSAPKEENFMSRTQQVHGEDEIEIEAIDGRGRRWYHLRPEPRRRTDLMGFNSTWWMAGGVAHRHRPTRLSVPVVVVT